MEENPRLIAIPLRAMAPALSPMAIPKAPQGAFLSRAQASSPSLFAPWLSR